MDTGTDSYASNMQRTPTLARPALARPALAHLALIPLTLLFACGEDPLPETAEETVSYTLSRLDSEEDPGVFWDLLPPSYQEDIHGWCRRLASELPGKSYDKLFLAVRKGGIVIKKQGEHLLSFGPFRYVMQMARGADEDDILAMLNAIGNVHILIGDSEIASLEKLGNIDFGRFLHETGAKVWQQGSRAYRVTGKSVGSNFERFSYKTIETEGDRAQLEVELDGRRERMAFTRIEGRWLPTDLVDNWATVRSEVESFLDSLDSAETRAFMKNLEEQLDEVIADLDELESIRSRGKFANALTNLGKKYSKKISGLVKLPW